MNIISLVLSIAVSSYNFPNENIDLVNSKSIVEFGGLNLSHTDEANYDGNTIKVVRKTQISNKFCFDGKSIKIEEENSSFLIDTNNMLSSCSGNACTLEKRVQFDDDLSYQINMEGYVYDNLVFIPIGNDFSIKLSNHYLISNNNIIIPAKKIIVDQLENNIYNITPIYDNEELSLHNVEFPCLSIANIEVDESINTGIQDKYYIDGTTYEYNNDTLLVGKDKLQIVSNNGSLIDTNYISAINISNISFKKYVETNLNEYYVIPSQYILNAKLNIRRKSYTFTKPNLKLMKVNNNIDFMNLNGISSLSTTQIATASSTLDNLSFDVTSYIQSGNQNGTNLLLKGSSGVAGFSTFYSKESNINNIEFEYLIQTSNLGNAPSYEELESFPNCLAYALQRNVAQEDYNNPITPFTLQYFYNIVDRYCNFRQLAAYNSPILPNERRIAFVFSSNEYHFITQVSEGGWAGKQGGAGVNYDPHPNPSDGVLFNLMITRSLENVDINPKIYYLAIRD